MRNFAVTFFAFAGILLTNCNTNKAQEEKRVLSATEFEQLLEATPDGQLLDVRTPQEFAGGHIEGALNYDWNDPTFEEQVNNLDKSEPVFVYCLSGGRSGAAAQKLRSDGYTVYELDGGMMKWRAANLPETSGTTAHTSGMHVADLDRMMQPGKLVVVDFYAEWCAPCKRMEPYLKKLEADFNNTVQLIRIDADQNPELCNELNVSSLPVIQIYANKRKEWDHLGYISETDLKSKIEELK